MAKTPTGKFRVAKEVVEELTRYPPFFEHLNDYRAATKLKSTCILHKMGTGGEAPVLHPSYDVLKASGRCSSFGEINAQNLPKKDGRVRRCFVPRPGNVFIDCDYKAIEMATLAQSVISQFGPPRAWPKRSTPARTCTASCRRRSSRLRGAGDRRPARSAA